MGVHPTTGESSPRSFVDVPEVRRALLALTRTGQVTELRILSARMASSPRFPYHASGYFNDADALVKSLRHVKGAKGAYITLHPCNPMLLSRAHNRLRTADEMHKAAATSDLHIARLHWLLIDLDPERPADISSTDEEHQMALVQAQAIKKTLEELNWPAPIEADSGNGAHLLYRVDLPIEEGTKETGLLHRVLKGLARRFDLSQECGEAGLLRLQVDQTVFNPSRICKLYGTLACKGDHTSERPHRMSRLLAVPAEPQTVECALLEAIATPLSKRPDRSSGRAGRARKTYTSVGRSVEFELETWISEHKLNVSGPVSWQDGRKWVFHVCPWNEDHTDRSAFIVQHADGSIGAGCHHNSCQDQNWQSLRALHEPVNGRRQGGTVRDSDSQFGPSTSSDDDAPSPDLTELNKALETHNLTRCLTTVPELARLTSPLYVQQKQRIKETFGKAVDLRDLDAAVMKARREAAQSDSVRANQVDLLVTLAEQQATFFADPGGVCYARVPVKNHVETLLLHERWGLFKRWLTWYYRHIYHTIPSDTALSSAMQTLTSSVCFEMLERQRVFIRVGEHEGCVYLDLANNEHQVVEISPQGWRVLSPAPVCFRRYNGMLELPLPKSGGTLALLDPFLNADEENRLLAKAWLMGCLHPSGPYPTLALHGERGAAKTTTARALRTLIDPCMALLRSAPKDIQALAVAAANNHIIGLDNLSSMPTWLSDALCRTATGAGDAYRQLYTDADEVIFNYTRPVIFTGIEELGTRGDFLDRCLLLHLPAIADRERRTEKAFWAAFEEAHPLILGALLDAVSLALRYYQHVELSQKPRMADFATWVSACESALLSNGQTAGTFMSIYLGNREEAVELEVEASQVGTALCRFMNGLEQSEWCGTAQELLMILNERESEMSKRSKGWPADARALSSRLKRLAPSLRSLGLTILWMRVKNKRQMIVRKESLQEQTPASGAVRTFTVGDQRYEEFYL